ncbi:hypothetical protein H4582DRAFT_2070034 [Lactarius indigo]|nr:hypothetical protein H4582DRAFT_2070034 [Lactarius indigo]
MSMWAIPLPTKHITTLSPRTTAPTSMQATLLIAKPISAPVMPPPQSSPPQPLWPPLHHHPS